MASNGTVKVVIDEAAMKRAIQNADGVQGILKQRVDSITANANALSAGMRTGIFHDHATGETRGDTQPEFEGNVEKRKGGYIGIVYTANYAAQKANMENNILLKAKG